MSALTLTPAGTTNTPNRLPLTRSEGDRQLLNPWLQRAKDARDDRRQYERQWMVNQHFAAGIQHLKWDQRDHRVLTVQRDVRGRLLDTVDVLSQFNATAIGKIASGDLRPEMLCSWQNDEAAEDANDLLNDALGYAWDEECKADRRIKAVLRALVELGTGAIRVRYDRSKGKSVAQEWPHRNGRPILDPEEARATVAAAYSGQPVPGLEMRPLREGYICWEKLSAWNLLPPPGIEDPSDFPWEIIVRPVALSTLKQIYGSKANGLHEDSLDEMGMLAYQNYGMALQQWSGRNGDSMTPAMATRLKAHALVYTGYEKPSYENPNGQTLVWAQDRILDTTPGLPLTDEPHGPRSGITYFRWTVLEGRFWGRAFMEPGVGVQKMRNKRLSQIDEIVDRGLPKVYAEDGTLRKRPKGDPLEIVYVEPGSTIPKSDGGIGPGPWMEQNLERADKDLEQALGLKGPSLGNVPTGVSAYSAMALLTENDATKLDPVASEFALGVADVTRDTIESMKQWPVGKQLYIAGDMDELKVLAWDAKKAIPLAFKARPAKGAALPRTQAARVQKIADIANYAATIGLAQADGDAWIEWYVRSLDAGDLLELPRKDSTGMQRHRAAMENSLMAYGSPAPPVAPYDDAQIHVQEHTDRMTEVQTALAFALETGDQAEAQRLQAELGQLDQHRQMHLAQAQANAAQNAQSLAPAPGAPGAPGASAAGPGAPELPLPRYMNEIQAPLMPRTHGPGPGVL